MGFCLCRVLMVCSWSEAFSRRVEVPTESVTQGSSERLFSRQVGQLAGFWPQDRPFFTIELEIEVK